MNIRNLACILIPALIQFPAFAEPEERITEITSEKLFFDYEGKIAVFTGNVVVTDPDLQLTSEKLTVYMTAEDEIEKLDAEKNVEIKMEGMHSKSGKAVYTLADGKVVLTEQPQVSRDGSILQAERILYWRLENKLEAFPRARVIMFQEADK
ncbi:MAG: LptA/OstA family protein [Kiritimatiellia bacterium]